MMDDQSFHLSIKLSFLSFFFLTPPSSYLVSEQAQSVVGLASPLILPQLLGILTGHAPVVRLAGRLVMPQRRLVENRKSLHRLGRQGLQVDDSRGAVALHGVELQVTLEVLGVEPGDGQSIAEPSQGCVAGVVDVDGAGGRGVHVAEQTLDLPQRDAASPVGHLPTTTPTFV